MQADFYEKLYTDNPKVKYSMSIKSKEPISMENKNTMDKPVTLAELQVAVRHFAPNKTPGVDGILAEFYRIYFDQIGQLLHDALMYGYEQNKLHISARRGVLTLIPKKDRNLLFLNGWRPLTILSLDYKILAKALDNRLKLVLPKVISDHQTGFMEGRNIMHNIVNLLLIVEDAKRKRLENLILLIDFEKCFDMISHTAIVGSLRYFGIGEEFIRWVMLLFAEFELCTQNNGHISRWFKPTRGVHQGCNISPHLFNCCGQVFSDLFYQNDKIDGYAVEDIIYLLSQFADDTSMFLKASSENLDEVTKTLQIAETQLGLKVNYNKTTIYRTGSLHNTNARYYSQRNFAWSDLPIYTLGVHITNNYKDMVTLNVLPCIEKARSVLNMWFHKDLTLTGRVLVANTLVESLFVYRFGVIPTIPQDILNAAQNDIWSFIWKGKRAKINFNILKQSKSNGGLRLVDLQAKHISISLQWIFKINNKLANEIRTQE